MAKEMTSSNNIPTKKTFGGAKIDHFSPKLPEGTPPMINITISFEDALKLHLSLGQALGKLNSYNRATKLGRRTAINLCIDTKVESLTVLEDKLRD